jgi:TonB-dependent receptor
MHLLVGRNARRGAHISVIGVLATLLGAPVLYGQGGGTVRGRVTTSPQGTGVSGAILHIKGTALGARTSDDGSYSITSVPAGNDTVLVRAVGFAMDSAVVAVADGGTVQRDFALHEQAATLAKVLVTASSRLNETVEAAREKQKDAPNVVDVLSGDEIRALPALNAAEASERIPGVTTERDEGEGKFVQIRGTEPTLQNVTIDGAHVPGTLSGDRSVKLDDIPADVIGAIEISKTMTAEMDADAIGGSVNIVSKVPEGAPRGYLSAQYGITSPEIVNTSSSNFAAGQGSLFYGGRVGKDQKLGFLIGGSFDRNDRPISDLEPSWSATTSPDNQRLGAFFPSNYDQRVYRYFRQRYGGDAEVDYRFNEVSTVFLKGLYSQFLNHGYRYVWSLGAGADGAGGFGTDGTSSRNISNRTPNEQLYGLTAGGTQDHVGPFHLDYAVNAAGTSSYEANYRQSQFNYLGPVSYQYQASNVLTPTYTIPNVQESQALLNPANYVLNNWNATNSKTLGLDAGAGINLSAHYGMGSSSSGLLQFGVKYRNEQKSFADHSVAYVANSLATITMDQLMGNVSDPNYYHNVFPVNVGPFGSVDRTTAYENANPQFFKNITDSLASLGGDYFGREQVSAAYVANTFTFFDRLHVNLGLRLEQTQLTYTGHPVVQDSTGTNVSAAGVTASHSYADLFPSLQIRDELDSNTNVRLALTRGIARPAYSDLAPHLTGSRNIVGAVNNSLSAGNPDLRPETAWNYDLLFEHFLPKAGVVSGGVFYKDLHDFIYDQRFFNYQGPIVEFHGANGTEPKNGRNASLYGFEADYAQHLTFLPGVWGGLGFDVNWTHVESRTSYVTGDSVLVDGAGHPTGQVITFVRHGLLPRTSPNIGNASLLYDHGPINARVAWVYQAAMLASTGGNASGDGTSSATSGDNYFYAHSQFDASIQVAVRERTTVQLQFLNINNAVFGFFNGTLSHQYDVQREYYGPTVYFGVRQGF